MSAIKIPQNFRVNIGLSFLMWSGASSEEWHSKHDWRMGWNIPGFLGAAKIEVIEFLVQLGRARNTLGVIVHDEVKRKQT